MNAIEEKFIDSLDRINFTFKNKEILTECVKSLDGLLLYGESFGPFEKGKKYRLKFFKAIPFIEHDILTVDHGEILDNVIVQRFAIAERDEQTIVNQDMEFLLNKIKEFKRFIEKNVRDGKKPRINLDKFNSYFASLLDARLLKLLRLTKSELSLSDERRLSKSEFILYEKLYELIREWRELFLIRKKN